MKKAKEQIKAELSSAWKEAVKKSDNLVRYRVYLDDDFDFRVLQARNNFATCAIVEHDDYGVEAPEDVEGVIDKFFDEIMAGVEQV